MSEYKIKVQSPAGVVLGEFTEFIQLKFGKKLNDFGSLEVTLPVSSDKINTLTALRRNTIWIYRNDVLVWSGEQFRRRGNLDDKGGGEVTIYAYTWLEQMRQRFTPETVEYEQEDQGLIAWDLIDTTQNDTNGDLGITFGSVDATMDRDRDYHNHNIYEVLVNLTNVISGIDIEITDDRVFNARGIIGEDKTEDIVLEYGHNIVSCTIDEDFTTPINRAIVLGQVANEDTLSRIEREDTDSQENVKLREDVLSEMTVSDLATFQEKGDSMLRKYAESLLRIDMQLLPGSPSIDQFREGDAIRLIVNKGFYSIDLQNRVYEWEVTFDKNNVEHLELLLGDFITL